MREVLKVLLMKNALGEQGWDAAGLDERMEVAAQLLHVFWKCCGPLSPPVLQEGQLCC